MRTRANSYYKHQHSCYLLQYHLVLVTKYRKNTLNGDIETRLIEFTKKYFSERKVNVLEINCNNDHMHILFEASPTITLSSFINAFKSASSRIMRNEFKEELAKYFWKPYFWSNTYFIGSVSEKTTNVVKEYIKNQKNK